MIRFLFLLLILAIGFLTVLVLLGRLLGQAVRFLGKPEVRKTWSWRWHAGGEPSRRSSQPMLDGKMVRDPVCGMFVSTELSHQLTEQGQTLHFCSRECLERYQKESGHS